MKIISKKIQFIFLAMIIVVSCGKDFLDQQPIGALDQDLLANDKGVFGLLVGSYSSLSGVGSGTLQWASSGDNWVFGSVVGGDANKGSNDGDQGDIQPLQRFVTATASNPYIRDKWIWNYDAINRCNIVLRQIPLAKDITTANATIYSAEARFLRGHYHFQAKITWKNVPYVSENNKQVVLGNDTDIWDKIQADFLYAYQNLPETQPQVGRANKWAAAAYLAKVYLYRQNWQAANDLLAMIVANGKNSGGTSYALLDKYHSNFDPTLRNTSEAVFQIQMSVDDGSPGNEHGNLGDQLNFPYGGPIGCCGFFQPSLDLANSFQVNGRGLPISTADAITLASIRELKTDLNVQTADAFTPDTVGLDPRIDWTIGRRGIPYLDYGNHIGFNWVRDQAYAGPYAPIKTVPPKTGGRGTPTANWGSDQTSNINYSLIRYADVLLWAAEAAVELNNLTAARTYVNMVRQRAQNPNGFVKKSDGTNAANYRIGLYSAADFSSQVVARAIVHFERKLEFGMEGHRFFDVARWSSPEFISTMQNYVNYEGKYLGWAKPANIVVIADNAFYAIPQSAIDQSVVSGQPAAIKQNPGHN